MAALALSARLPIRPRPQARAVSCGLDFARTPGPLLAICALVGGSGASTLAIGLARQAARESRVPVLLTESDCERAGLAAITRHASATGLAGLAVQPDHGTPSTRPFVELEPRLRLVAALPGRDRVPQPEAMSGVLKHARDAHGLVVVDCGTSWSAAGAILEHATHVLWTVTAAVPSIEVASILLDSSLVPAPGRRKEALVATAAVSRPRGAVRALRRLAETRCERLILSPVISQPENGSMPRTLAAIASFLRRR